MQLNTCFFVFFSLNSRLWSSCKSLFGFSRLSASGFEIQCWHERDLEPILFLLSLCLSGVFGYAHEPAGDALPD